MIKKTVLAALAFLALGASSQAQELLSVDQTPNSRRTTVKVSKKTAFTANDIKPGDIVVWDSVKKRFVAIDGGLAQITANGKSVFRQVDLKSASYNALGVVMYVLEEGETAGERERIIQPASVRYMVNWEEVISHRFPDYGKRDIEVKYKELKYHDIITYPNSALRSLKLSGIWSQDGKTMRHAYVMGFTESEKLVYSSDEDKIAESSSWKGICPIYYPGLYGLDYYNALEKYNDNRGASHRIKVNYAADRAREKTPLPGATSGWFVPTYTEIELMAWGAGAVQHSLVALAKHRKDVTPLKTNSEYWTISEALSCDSKGRLPSGEIIAPETQSHTKFLWHDVHYSSTWDYRDAFPVKETANKAHAWKIVLPDVIVIDEYRAKTKAFPVRVIFAL